MSKNYEKLLTVDFHSVLSQLDIYPDDSLHRNELADLIGCARQPAGRYVDFGKYLVPDAQELEFITTNLGNVKADRKVSPYVCWLANRLYNLAELLGKKEIAAIYVQQHPEQFDRRCYEREQKSDAVA